MFGQDIYALTPRTGRQEHQYGYPVMRSQPIEFSGSNQAELLSPQNYARAFDLPCQPADIDDLNYARAFDLPFEPVAVDPSFGDHLRETDNGQPHFHGHRDIDELNNPIHARAFDFPFQPAAIDSMTGGYLRGTANIQPGFLDHNSTGASDHLMRFTATDSIPEDPCRQAGGSDFTADPLEHRPPNGHSPRIGAGGIRSTAEQAVHRSSILDERCQHIVDEIWRDQGVAQSFGTDTIRLIGEPHMAQMVI